MLNFLKNKNILISKLLKNILLILLFFWTLAILGEAFLPGLISSQISFLKLGLFIFLIISSIYLLNPKKESNPSTGNRISILNIFIFFGLITFVSILALLNFDYLSITIIVFATLLIAFYLHREFFDIKK